LEFQMASLKNDSAIYDLLVELKASYFQAFNGTLIPQPTQPPGSVWYPADSSDVRLTYSFEWTPEEQQEGVWLVCFDTSDSFFVTTERRCVYVEVVRCLRCVRPGESLVSLLSPLNPPKTDTRNTQIVNRAGSAVCRRGCMLPGGDGSVAHCRARCAHARAPPHPDIASKKPHSRSKVY
jgi:hypothetical protein